MEKEFKLNKNKIIKAHEAGIPKISLLPSKRIISISNDLSIKIWDENFNLLQKINDAHNEYITYIEIENENNFITCSDDRSIRFWSKKNNIYSLKETIIEAHKSGILKIKYIKNKKYLISCSEDETIKIWEKKNMNNKHECVLIIQFQFWIFSIMEIPDKNLLLIAGPFPTIFFYNTTQFNLSFCINNVNCRTNNSIDRIDNDRIIFGGRKDSIIKIISLSLKKIIKEIYNQTYCWGVLVIKHLHVFLVGGYNSYDIKVYHSDNYNLIYNVINAHNKGIYGFTLINENCVSSYSLDGTIRLWNF